MIILTYIVNSRVADQRPYTDRNEAIKAFARLRASIDGASWWSHKEVNISRESERSVFYTSGLKSQSVAINEFDDKNQGAKQ
jgi:hypothetical protein